MKTVFSDQGDLRSVDVLAALVALWREGASGALHFSRSGASAGFQLSAGELTAVTSSESRFETASILLRAGKLEAATLERLSTPPGGDRALSALKAGVLTKREWRWGEKIRAVEVLSDLLTWIEGDYAFDRGAHGDAGEFRLTVPRLILELFLRSRDRSLVLHYLGGADVPLARAPHFDSEFAAFGLTADAEAVVRLIDGKSTAARIASEGPAETFAVEKLLAALVTLGLVHPEFVAPEGARTWVAPEPRTVIAPEPEPLTDGEDSPAIPEQFESEPEAEVRESAEEDRPGEPAGAAEPAEEAYTALDVAESSDEDEEEEETSHELEADLGAPEDAEVRSGEEEEESAVGESEIGAGHGTADELSIAAERLRPGLGRSFESADSFGDAPIEYGRLADASVSTPEIEHEEEEEEGDGPSAMEHEGPGPSSLESGPEERLPLDFATGVGSLERPKPRSGGRLLWLLVLLAAGVGAVILLRGRGATPPSATTASAIPGVAAVETPTPAVHAEMATTEVAAPFAATSPLQTPIAALSPRPTPKVPGPVPTPAKAQPTPRRAQPTPIPTSPRAPTPRAAAKAAPTPSASRTASPVIASEPPGSTRQAWLDRAARDRQRANADRKSHFTIQLELACETGTLVDAWKYDRPAGTLWVLTTPFEGRTCFRVLWGHYATKDAARRALAGVPPFFSSPHNRPVVTAIR